MAERDTTGSSSTSDSIATAMNLLRTYGPATAYDYMLHQGGLERFPITVLRAVAVAAYDARLQPQPAVVDRPVAAEVATPRVLHGRFGRARAETSAGAMRHAVPDRRRKNLTADLAG